MQSISMSAVTNYTNGRTDSFPNKIFFQGEVFYYNLELHVFHALYATDFLQPALDRIMPVDRNWIDLHLALDPRVKLNRMLFTCGNLRIIEWLGLEESLKIRYFFSGCFLFGCFGLWQNFFIIRSKMLILNKKNTNKRQLMFFSLFHILCCTQKL